MGILLSISLLGFFFLMVRKSVKFFFNIKEIKCTGFTTITSTAILFGKTTLHMSPSALILVGVLTPTSGILGSLAWPFLQRRFAWTNLQVLVLLIIMASMIPAYGCLGFFFQGRTKFGGLTTQEEMFGLAVYFGWHIFISSFERVNDYNHSQVRCMVHFRVMQEPFMQNCSLQGKKPDGMGYSQSRTRFGISSLCSSSSYCRDLCSRNHSPAPLSALWLSG